MNVQKKEKKNNLILPNAAILPITVPSPVRMTIPVHEPTKAHHLHVEQEREIKCIPSTANVLKKARFFVSSGLS